MLVKLLKIRYIIFIIVILLLAGLNIHKYRQEKNKVQPVWSSYDEDYYGFHKNQGWLQKTKNFFRTENLIYQLTSVRIRAPLTYLKSEIPYLAHYTPEELKEPEKTIYEPQVENNRIIRLKFDLRKENPEVKEEKEERSNKLPAEERINIKNQPVIAIYHTHTSETYMDDPREQDNHGHVFPGEIGNIARVGQELSKSLSNKYGFKVIHTTAIHDDRKFYRAYYFSKQTVRNIIEKNNKIDMIFDLHRDYIAEASRKDVITIIDGKRVAKIMIVVANGQNAQFKVNHPHWKENYRFARALADKMNELYPGLLRRIEERKSVTYNQDLHPHALLLEIGDYRNTTQEALRAVRLLADVIARLVVDEGDNLNLR